MNFKHKKKPFRQYNNQIKFLYLSHTNLKKDFKVLTQTKDLNIFQISLIRTTTPDYLIIIHSTIELLVFKHLIGHHLCRS